MPASLVLPAPVYEKTPLTIAPMMAWTDRHCRYLLRLTAARPLLFTEMITTGALLYGPSDRLLRFDPQEQPLAIQLGGSEPAAMARAAELVAGRGFSEININVGCPSPRVKRGAFGACLMREAALVADMVRAMTAVVSTPISVKCRLGVDEHDSQPLLEEFVETVAAAGCGRFYLHARKALLNGISPAQNRQIPPLQYERVYALKQRFPELQIHINGGISSTGEVLEHLRHTDGVMIGRQAYQQPLFVNELASTLFGEPVTDAFAVMNHYLTYMDRELAKGTRLADMTRHCLGLFAGLPGARQYRRLLSDQRRLKHNELALVVEAIDAVRLRAA